MSEFENGSRVFHKEWGSYGRVRAIEDENDPTRQQVSWEGSFVSDEMDLCRDKLVRADEQERGR